MRKGEVAFRVHAVQLLQRKNKKPERERGGTSNLEFTRPTLVEEEITLIQGIYIYIKNKKRAAHIKQECTLRTGLFV